MRVSSKGGAFAIVALLASVRFVGGCVDGVTPDCSNPAVCAPSEGDASSSDSALAEAASDTGTGTTDAGSPDADADALSDASDADTVRALHRTIAGVREELDSLRFNTAIAKLIELNNAVTKLDATQREVAEPMVVMLAPLVPHIAAELWRLLGHTDTITYVAFAEADPALLVDDTVEIPVQINGKVRGRIDVAADADAATIEAAALADEKIAALVDGATPKKVIVVPGRMVNIVL